MTARANQANAFGYKLDFSVAFFSSLKMLKWHAILCVCALQRDKVANSMETRMLIAVAPKSNRKQTKRQQLDNLRCIKQSVHCKNAVCQNVSYTYFLFDFIPSLFLLLPASAAAGAVVVVVVAAAFQSTAAPRLTISNCFVFFSFFLCAHQCSGLNDFLFVVFM